MSIFRRPFQLTPESSVSIWYLPLCSEYMEIVINHPLIICSYSERKGRLASLVYNSFRWRSIRLFNAMPKNIRCIYSCSVVSFKSKLDCYLKTIVVDLPGRPGFRNSMDYGDISQWWTQRDRRPEGQLITYLLTYPLHPYVGHTATMSFLHLLSHRFSFPHSRTHIGQFDYNRCSPCSRNWEDPLIFFLWVSISALPLDIA